jgi:uncharacterized pyridoxamine 5'-phosphate oxidase family protein
MTKKGVTKKLNKETDLSGIETLVNYALVLRGPIKDFDAIKQCILETFPHVKILYQTLSSEKIVITKVTKEVKRLND